MRDYRGYGEREMRGYREDERLQREIGGYRER